MQFMTQATVVATKDWEDYDIPLCFLGIQHPDLRFRVVASDQGFEDEMEHLTLHGISFIVRSQKATDFSFELKSVASVFDSDLENIKNVFPQRPVFFRACPDYSKVEFKHYQTNEVYGTRVFEGSKEL